MHNYSWMKNRVAAKPTADQVSAFRRARADQATLIASEWAAKGDREQVERWLATADALRKEG